MAERFAHYIAPIRMDHAIIRPSQSLVKRGGPAAQLRLSDDRSLSEAARRKMLSKGVLSGPGRFGPSRKKEAAARRFGNYELWVLNAAMIPDSAVGGRMGHNSVVGCRSESRLWGSPGAERGSRGRSPIAVLVDGHTWSEACRRTRPRSASRAAS